MPIEPVASRKVVQATLMSAIGCTGVGLHSGLETAITLRPAPADTGVRFVRYDHPAALPCPARFDHVENTTLCTSLGQGPGRVDTIEHLMAAFAACGVDNALVEVGGSEVPIMDGSARPFVRLIECAGIEAQDRPRRAIEVLKPVAVAVAGKTARLEPCAGFELEAEIRFAHPVIQSQSLAFVFTPDAFKTAIAPARTFGFAEAVEELWARGLARGGSLDNAVVVSEGGVLNPEGLRFPDEFVRHKLLDAVGDLYLAGGPIFGRYVGVCAGHALHNRLLHRLFADPSAYRMVDLPPETAGTWPEEAGASLFAARG